MACTVRPLTVADHAACARVWRACVGLGAAPDARRLADFLARNPGYSQVALVDEEVIGVILASFDGIRGYLYRLAVDPTQRRRGVASTLVAAARDALRAAGVSHVNFHLFADNLPARAFWQTHDFAPFLGLEMWSLRFDGAPVGRARC